MPGSPGLKDKRFVIMLCLGLMLLINVEVLGQSADFPKPFEIASDTATNIILPALSWQYFTEPNKQLPFSDVIGARHIFKFKSKGSSKQDLRRLQGYWFRYSLKNDLDKPLAITLPGDLKQVDFYIAENKAAYRHFVTGKDIPWSQRAGLKKIRAVTYTLLPKGVVTVYQRNLSDDDNFSLAVAIGIKDNVINRDYINNDSYQMGALVNAIVFGFLLFAALFNFFFFYIIREKVYLLYGIMLLLVAFYNITEPLPNLVLRDHPVTFNSITSIFFVLIIPLGTIIVPIFLQTAQRYPKWNRVLLTSSFVLFACLIFQWLAVAISGYTSKILATILIAVIVFLIVGIAVTFIIDLLKRRFAARLFMVAIAPCLFAIILVSVVALIKSVPNWLWILLEITLLWPVIVLCWAMFDRFKSVLHENARQAIEKERLAKEKEEERSKLITRQKEELELQVAERTHQLSQSLNHLKATQTQLIQSEKMASLGELTAGIAHEIQNPLNFVNNFSEVNEEMLEELKAESEKPKAERDWEMESALVNDLIDNERKIKHHGKRADAIVKGMLEHSRVGSGEKQLTDLNALADEFLKLSYHGLRAKDKNFNAQMLTDFEPGLPKVNVSQQDMGRVMLNLFNNAFYAANQKSKSVGTDYKPEVSVTTLYERSGVIIRVKDNGIGIPDTLKDKIMQPFFTTKPTGEGTGLGLSLSYDIVVKGHGGSIDVDTKENEYTVLTIKLPL